MKNYHFIYKTSHNNGYYYFGRHSTKNLKDGYQGSGKWIKSIKKMSEAQKIIQNKEDVRLKIKLSQKGKKRKPLSDTHKENIGKSLVGKKQKIEKCIHCQIEGGLNMMRRYHFDNCKHKYLLDKKG